MEDSEVRVALTTEPIGKDLWQWVVVYASAERIVRVNRSEIVFPSVAEALVAGQQVINAIRLTESGWRTPTHH
ncbi:MAG TPA: hypothetical protein VEY69_17755 [Lautropia sp.]|jgi:hypothetical protein|nr:hypothetical protein [Lautropia sp.]